MVVRLNRLAFTALGASLVCLIVSGCGSPAPKGNTQRVTINGHTFDLELALDWPTQLQGLSDRKQIAPDGGMLFVFTDSKVRFFVMRRCLVDIDIIFLDPDGQVTATHHMTTVPSGTPEEDLKPYSSEMPAQFAIELRGGTLADLHLQPGDKIDLPLDDLKSRAH